MAQWSFDPKIVACIIIQHQPYEAQEIVLDFLQQASNNSNHDQTAFWIIVHSMIEQMQSQLDLELDYDPELRFAAVI